MNKEEWIEAALPYYILTNPALLAEISGLSEKDQLDQILWAFEDEAEALNIEPWELALDFSDKSEDEVKALRLAVHQEAAKTLEMDWEEYCALNAVEV
ncbi:DUF6388 family protein [Pseudomonas sp. S2_H01]|jgi:hypothetical protein